MYCIIHIIALSFGEELDVIDVPSWKHKECRVMSKMRIAVSTFSACTALNIVTVVGSTRPGADTVSRVCEEMEGVVLETKREETLQTADQNHSDELDVEDNKMRGVQKAESVKREPPTVNDVPEFCFELCGDCTAAGEQRSTEKAKNINHLVSSAAFDAEQLRRHVKKVESFEPPLKDSQNEALAREDFAKKTVKSGSGFSESEVVLYRKHVFCDSTESDTDGLVAGLASQLIRCSYTRRESCGGSTQEGNIEWRA